MGIRVLLIKLNLNCINRLFSIFRIPKSYLVKGDWVPLDPIKAPSNYLRIEAENPEIVVNKSVPFQNRLAFWDTILDTVDREKL